MNYDPHEYEKIVCNFDLQSKLGEWSFSNYNVLIFPLYSESSLTVLLNLLKKPCSQNLKNTNSTAAHFSLASWFCLDQIDELLTLSKKADGIEVGASVTISNFIEFLESREAQESKAPANGVASTPNETSSVPNVLAAHLKKIASNHVRNWGSVGGNLMMAKLYNFESDVATILLGVDAQVKVVSPGSKGPVTKTVRLEDFIWKGALENGELLQSIWMPLDKASSQGGPRVHFKTFRAAPRPLGFALAYVNAAFFARVSETGGGETKLEDVRLALGAFGTKHAIRARRVESHLNGKSLTWDVILEAVRLLRADVVPVKRTRKAEYRVSVAESFLFQFLAPLLQDHEVYASKPTGMLSSGKQTITVTDEYYPVGQPAAKMASELQASGMICCSY